MEYMFCGGGGDCVGCGGGDTEMQKEQIPMGSMFSGVGGGGILPCCWHYQQKGCDKF